MAFPRRWNSASRWPAARRSSRWRACCGWTPRTGRWGRCWPFWEATIFVPNGRSGKAANPAGQRSRRFGGCKSRVAAARCSIASAAAWRVPLLACPAVALVSRHPSPRPCCADWRPRSTSFPSGRRWPDGATPGSGWPARPACWRRPIPRRSACCPSARAIGRRGRTCKHRSREDDRLSQWLGREAPTLDCRAALAVLLDIAASRRLRPGSDDGGRVRVLSAANARALRMPYVFLASLSEKSFPSPEREDRLYGRAEAQRLVEGGLPLVTRWQRSSEEMLLFYEAATRATRRLWLSYPAMDASAQPLSPSPYLQEVEQACGAGRIPRIVRNDLNPVPADDGPLSPAGAGSGRRPWPWRGTSRSWQGSCNRPTPTRPTASAPGWCTSHGDKFAGSSARRRECFPARRLPPWRASSPRSESTAPRNWSNTPPAPSAIFLSGFSASSRWRS